MKAIIIEEDRFMEIVEILQYETERLIANSKSIDERKWISDAHRTFHFHLVKWAQSHGVSFVAGKTP